MPQQQFYDSQEQQLVVDPKGINPLATDNAHQSLLNAASKAGLAVLGKMAADHTRDQELRVDAAFLNASRRFDTWKDQYNQSHKGENSFDAQNDYGAAYNQIMQDVMKEFDGAGNEYFKNELTKKLVTKNFQTLREGYDFQEKEKRNWHQSVYDAKIANFKQIIAEDPDDNDYIDVQENDIIKSWMTLNPGLDPTKALYDLKRMRAEEQVSTWMAKGESDKYLQAIGYQPGELVGTTKQDQQIASGAFRQDPHPLAQSHESGKEKSACVAFDPHGGTSYGLYQLSSAQGSLQGFLKFARDYGGEAGKEIYDRMLAAGGLNTGSTKGNAPEVWKQLVHEGKLGTGELERAYMEKSHYNPAYLALKPEIKTLVDNSKTLQEVLFSTAVQHGAGGAPSIFNKVFKTGMTTEDFISAIYDDRGNHFQSSPKSIQIAAKRRMTEEKGEALAMIAQEHKTAHAGKAGAPSILNGGNPYLSVAFKSQIGAREDNLRQAQSNLAMMQQQKIELQQKQAHFENGINASLASIQDIDSPDERLLKFKEQVSNFADSLPTMEEGNQFKSLAMQQFQWQESSRQIQEKKQSDKRVNIITSMALEQLGNQTGSFEEKQMRVRASWDEAKKQFSQEDQIKGDSIINHFLAENSKEYNLQSAITLKNTMQQLKTMPIREALETLPSLNLPQEIEEKAEKILTGQANKTTHENRIALSRARAAFDQGDTIDSYDLQTQEGREAFAYAYNLTDKQLEDLNSYTDQGGNAGKLKESTVREAWRTFGLNPKEYSPEIFDTIQRDIYAHRDSYAGKDISLNMVKQVLAKVLTPVQVKKYIFFNGDTTLLNATLKGKEFSVPDEDARLIRNELQSQGIDTANSQEKTGYSFEDNVKRIYVKRSQMENMNKKKVKEDQPWIF